MKQQMKQQMKKQTEQQTKHCRSTGKKCQAFLFMAAMLLMVITAALLRVQGSVWSIIKNEKSLEKNTIRLH